MKPTCPKCGGSLDSDRHRYCGLNRTEAEIAASGNILRLPECDHCKVFPAFGSWIEAAVDKVLAHKPKAKSKRARKRARRATAAESVTQEFQIQCSRERLAAKNNQKVPCLAKAKISTPANATLVSSPGTVARLMDRLLQQDPRAQLRFAIASENGILEMELLSVYSDDKGTVWVELTA